MPRPRSIIPKRRPEVQLPEDLYARVLSDLYSEAEGCVPYGAFSRFVEECIREHYRTLEQSCTQGNCPPAESGGQTAGLGSSIPAVSMNEQLGGGDVGCEAHNVMNCPWCKS
jgi:hypothetical protein